MFNGLEFMSFEDFKVFCNHYEMFKLRFYVQYHCNITLLEELIDLVSNLNYFTILHMKYLEHRTLLDISNNLGYSYRYVINLHSKAIKLLYELYSMNYRD